MRTRVSRVRKLFFQFIVNFNLLVALLVISRATFYIYIKDVDVPNLAGFNLSKHKLP